jgi:hypothetical protein
MLAGWPCSILVIVVTMMSGVSRAILWPCNSNTVKASGSGSLYCTFGWRLCNPDTRAYFWMCTPCEVGKYSAAAQNQGATCAACPAGKTNVNTGQSVCQECLAGTYNANPPPQPPPPGSVGQLVCQACQAGTYNANIGQSVCPACLAGTYNANPGQSTCVGCQQGTFASSLGSKTCQPCTAGYFCSTTAQTACQLGWFSLAGASVCTACPAGSYCSSTAATACGVGFYWCVVFLSAVTPGFVDKPSFLFDCPLFSCSPQSSSTQTPCPEGFYCSSSIVATSCEARFYWYDLSLGLQNLTAVDHHTESLSPSFPAVLNHLQRRHRAHQASTMIFLASRCVKRAGRAPTTPILASRCVWPVWRARFLPPALMGPVRAPALYLACLPMPRALQQPTHALLDHTLIQLARRRAFPVHWGPMRCRVEVPFVLYAQPDGLEMHRASQRQSVQDCVATVIFALRAPRRLPQCHALAFNRAILCWPCVVLFRCVLHGLIELLRVLCLDGCFT